MLFDTGLMTGDSSYRDNKNQQIFGNLFKGYENMKTNDAIKNNFDPVTGKVNQQGVTNELMNYNPMYAQNYSQQQQDLANKNATSAEALKGSQLANDFNQQTLGNRVNDSNNNSFVNNMKMKETVINQGLKMIQSSFDQPSWDNAINFIRAQAPEVAAQINPQFSNQAKMQALSYGADIWASFEKEKDRMSAENIAAIRKSGETSPDGFGELKRSTNNPDGTITQEDKNGNIRTVRPTNQDGTNVLSKEQNKKVDKADESIKKADSIIVQLNGSIELAKDLISDPDINKFWNTGNFTGAIAEVASTTGLKSDFKTKLQTLESRNVLTAMGELKAESPTGSTGFGALNLKELETLQTSQGYFKLNQSKDSLIKNLNKFIKQAGEAINRLNKAINETKSSISKMTGSSGNQQPSQPSTPVQSQPPAQRADIGSFFQTK